MFSKLVGYFSIFMGVLWLVWPGLLRGWLAGKTTRHIFWLLLGAFFFPLFRGAGKFGLEGFLAVIIGFWLLMKFAGAAIQAAAARIPALAFRAAGLLNIVSGCWLLFKR